MPICGVGLLPYQEIVRIVDGTEMTQIAHEGIMRGFIGGPFTLRPFGFASFLRVRGCWESIGVAQRLDNGTHTIFLSLCLL